MQCVILNIKSKNQALFLQGMHNFCIYVFASGAFSDTKMLVSPTQNSGVGGLSQRQGKRNFFASQWNIGFIFLIGCRITITHKTSVRI